MPQNNHEQRLQHLLEHQAQDLALLKDYEDKLRLSDDPKEKLQCKQEIAEAKQRLQLHEVELAELQRPILASYLEFLVNCYRDLTVRGIMQVAQSVTTLPLDEVYVSLAVTREVSARLPSHEFFAELESEAARQWEQAVRREHWPNRQDAERRTERIECHQAVSDFDRIVLLGLRGAGKTTLTSFLTLQFALATQQKAETVIDRQGQSYGATRLPICMRVSEYSRALKQNAALKLGEFLPQPFIKQTGLTHVAALFQQTLAKGNALVLLDGLDEIIGATERSHIRREIEEFIAATHTTNAGNRFIITSRIAGYAKASLRSDYVHLTLAPLELAEIERFVNRWCVAVERHASVHISDDEAARRAAPQIEGILRGVNDNKGVQRLAVNPLLLTILALIYRNGSQLPNRRVELYELATNSLLCHWQVERGSSSGVAEHEAQQFLYPLAHWLHSERETGTATGEEIKERLCVWLAEQRGVKKTDPKVLQDVNEFLDRVKEQTGLLVERSPNEFGFMHLTFEEYFAARHLVADTDEAADELHKLRHQPRWEEPLLLAIAWFSGHFPRSQGKLIRKAILGEGAGFAPSAYESILHRDLLLAGQAIGDCNNVEPAVHQSVVTRLLELFAEVEGAGKYQDLRRRIVAVFENMRGTVAGAEAVSGLLRLLEQAASDDVRGQAASALGQLKATEAVSGLLRLLEQATSDYVRGRAADALVQIGGAEAVSGLLRLLDETTSDDVRGHAAEALGQLKAAEAVSSLLRLLEQATSDDVLGRAAGALGKLKATEAVSGLLRLLVKKERDSVSQYAVEALGEIGGTEALNGLLRLLDETISDDVRRSAARALGQLKATEAVSRLLRLLDETTSDDVRIFVAWALGDIGSAEALNGLLRLLDETISDDVRIFVAWALGDIGSAEAVSRLLRLLDETTSDDVRRFVAWALGNSGSAEAVSRLLRLLGETTSDDVRRLVAEALGEIGEIEAVSGLLRLLDKTISDDVRRSAAGALLSICRNHINKLSQPQRHELAHWAVTELPLELNAKRQGFGVGDNNYYEYLYDVLWEILWLVA